MSLPEPQKSPHPPGFEHLVLTTPHQVKQRKPYVPPEQPAIFTLQPASPHNTVQASVVEVVSGEIHTEKSTVAQGMPLAITARDNTSYLIRLHQPDNTIAWQFFHSGSSLDFK